MCVKQSQEMNFNQIDPKKIKKQVKPFDSKLKNAHIYKQS